MTQVVRLAPLRRPTFSIVLAYESSCAKCALGSFNVWAPRVHEPAGLKLVETKVYLRESFFVTSRSRSLRRSEGSGIKSIFVGFNWDKGRRSKKSETVDVSKIHQRNHGSTKEGMRHLILSKCEYISSANDSIVSHVRQLQGPFKKQQEYGYASEE